MNNYNYRDSLENEYLRRKDKNGSYSKRAFARDLSLSSSSYSEVLNHKYGLSVKKAKEVSKKLYDNPIQQQIFLEKVKLAKTTDPIEQEKLKSLINLLIREDELELNYFSFIKDWYHVGIIELIELEDFKFNVEWIARKLDISEIQVVNAIERLFKLGLIKKDKHKGIKSTSEGKLLRERSSCCSIQFFHQSIMEKSVKGLEKYSLEQRNVSHSILAINKNDLEDFKLDMMKWRREMSEKYTNKNKAKNSLYVLGIQLMPLSF